MNRELRPLPGAFAVGGGLNRRYSGTAGLTESYQVRVLLTHVTGRVHTLSDRRLHLPASWTDDRERDRRARTEDNRWRMVLHASELRSSLVKGLAAECSRTLKVLLPGEKSDDGDGTA